MREYADSPPQPVSGRDVGSFVCAGREQEQADLSAPKNSPDDPVESGGEDAAGAVRLLLVGGKQHENLAVFY